MEVAKDRARNLSDENVSRRLRVGIAFLILALALATVFDRLELAAGHRLWLFVPFFLASNAFYQAIYKTCGFSAYMGMRHTPHGDERVADRRCREAARHRGRRQIAFSVLAALACTGAFLLII